MAGALERADASFYCNWSNLTLLNHFLRPKVFGLTLVGRTDLKEVDVRMHHPEEIFGSEPRWKHMFFFTHRRWNQPRAGRAAAEARGGYWLRTGLSELVKEIDDTCIGSKEQFVFYEGLYVGDCKRTNWYLNEYLIFEKQPLNGKQTKKKTWILFELFLKLGAEDKEGGKNNSEYPDRAGFLLEGLRVPPSKKRPHLPPRPEAFPVVNLTLAGDQPSEAISGVKELNQTPSGRHDGQTDAQCSTRSGGWKDKRVEEYYTLKDHDDFLAFMEECVKNPPDWEYWGLWSSECSPLPSGMDKDS